MVSHLHPKLSAMSLAFATKFYQIQIIIAFKNRHWNCVHMTHNRKDYAFIEWYQGNWDDTFPGDTSHKVFVLPMNHSL